jgi:hypothetical protein
MGALVRNFAVNTIPRLNARIRRAGGAFRNLAVKSTLPMVKRELITES